MFVKKLFIQLQNSAVDPFGDANESQNEDDDDDDDDNDDDDDEDQNNNNNNNQKEDDSSQGSLLNQSMLSWPGYAEAVNVNQSAHQTHFN